MPESHYPLYFADEFSRKNQRQAARARRVGGMPSGGVCPRGDCGASPRGDGDDRGLLGDGSSPRGDTGSWPRGDGGSYDGPMGDGTNCRGCRSLVRLDGIPESAALVVGLGYVPEVSDHRDYQFHGGPAKGQRVLQGLRNNQAFRGNHLFGNGNPPAEVNLLDRIHGQWPVNDQGQLGSCTAHAVVGLLEYLSLVQADQSMDLSRLFLYDATLRMLGWTGDNGAYIRSTIKAAAAFGVPPEDVWPYVPTWLGVEPDAYAYAYAGTMKATQYFRLDGYDSPPAPQQQPARQRPARQQGAAPISRGKQVLRRLKQMLAEGYPVAFGFPIYDCIIDASPDIPYPAVTDRLVGGHAVAAVGYATTETEFQEPFTWLKPPKQLSILIRNSWGREWGLAGYGWLPERYFSEELATDLWTIFKA